MARVSIVTSFLRSMPGRMISGMLLTNLILGSILIAGVMYFVRQDYQAQFVNHVRSQAYTLANMISPDTRRTRVDALLADIQLSGQVTYAAFSGTDSPPPANGLKFKEDFFFGGNDDSVYYLSIPVIDSAGAKRGTLWLGYDETFVTENFWRFYKLIFVLALVYLLALMLMTVTLSLRLTRPLTELQQISRKIAAGDLHQTLTVISNLPEIASLSTDLEFMRHEVVRHSEEIAAHLEEIIRVEEQARMALSQKLEAEARNKAKGIFIANISHELRTPLNIMLGYSQMLSIELTQKGHEEWSSDVSRIYAAGAHLLALVNELLDLSKIDAGKMQINLALFEVEPVIQEIAAAIKPLASKNLNHFEVHASLPLGSMLADNTKVKQIALNLLSNACKFTENGQILFAVQRISQDEKDWLILAVTDTGMGIDHEQINRLFEPFEQGDDSTTRKHAGTGLGLAITKRLCEMTGGSIEVESSPGKGSSFTVRLPAVWQSADHESPT